MKKLNSNIIKMLLIILAGLFLSGNIFAQPNRQHNHPPMMPDSSKIVEMVKDLSERLSLTDEQQERISKMHFAHFAEAKEKMEAQKTSWEKHRKEMDTLRRKFENEVKSVLTAEQINSFEAFVKQHQPAGRKKWQGRR